MILPWIGPAGNCYHINTGLKTNEFVLYNPKKGNQWILWSRLNKYTFNSMAEAEEKVIQLLNNEYQRIVNRANKIKEVLGQQLKVQDDK